MTSNKALLPRVTCSHAHNPTQVKDWAYFTFLELQRQADTEPGNTTKSSLLERVYDLGLQADKWTLKTKCDTIRLYTNSGNHGMLILRNSTSSATPSPTPTPTKCESHCACYCYCQRYYAKGNGSTIAFMIQLSTTSTFPCLSLSQLCFLSLSQLCLQLSRMVVWRSLVLPMSIHAYIHTSIHAYIHAPVRSPIHPCIHKYVPAYMHALRDRVGEDEASASRPRRRSGWDDSA